MSPGPRVLPTAIPGLLVVELPVHRDNRGWFKENWQHAAMTALGLPDFGPVQNNVSFNEAAGTTRGIHAEPWDKLVSVASGRVFGAWVDLREGDGFGRSVTLELGPDRAVFVPRGVGNAYQTLEESTAYTYLVNDHWSPDAAYTNLALGDETAAIDWPIPLSRAELSAKDRGHPGLDAVAPVRRRTPAVLGAGGQLGRALRTLLPGAAPLTRRHLDLADDAALHGHDWARHSAIVVAGAYTDVDGAETDAGRMTAWAVNARATATLARIADAHRLPLVYVSSDYVFDGRVETHAEDEPFSPLGVYGQTKAAGEIAASSAARHYIVRTSWVVGDGANFVRTMRSLAERGADPRVVDDQFGRLTFADELARGIRHLLESEAAYGTYNLTNTGPVLSWYDIARKVFELTGHDARRVHAVPTERTRAPRPRHSALDLAKIESTGFRPRDAEEALRDYLRRG